MLYSDTIVSTMRAYYKAAKPWGALCTDMAEYFSSLCETGLAGRRSLRICSQQPFVEHRSVEMDVVRHTGSPRIAACRDASFAVASLLSRRIAPRWIVLDKPVCARFLSAGLAGVRSSVASRCHIAFGREGYAWSNDRRLNFGRLSFGWSRSDRFRPDRFRRGRQIRSSSRLALSRFAQQRLIGWVLPPQ